MRCEITALKGKARILRVAATSRSTESPNAVGGIHGSSRSRHALKGCVAAVISVCTFACKSHASKEPLYRAVSGGGGVSFARIYVGLRHSISPALAKEYNPACS